MRILAGPGERGAISSAVGLLVRWIDTSGEPIGAWREGYNHNSRHLHLFPQLRDNHSYRRKYYWSQYQSCLTHSWTETSGLILGHQDIWKTNPVATQAHLGPKSSSFGLKGFGLSATRVPLIVGLAQQRTGQTVTTRRKLYRCMMRLGLFRGFSTAEVVGLNPNTSWLFSISQYFLLKQIPEGCAAIVLFIKILNWAA